MSNPTRHPEKYECQLSTKYTEFIKDHIDTLKTKCQEFTTCINELLTHQSAFALISGEDINLRTICGMLQSDDDSTYKIDEAKCTSAEKETIKTDIEQHLNDKIKDQQSWNKVKKCLGNNYGDKERSTYVNEICGLAKKQDHLCNKRDIHNQVETFFNEELHHLRCTCESLNADDKSSSSASIGAIVGGVLGGLLLLVLATLLGIFYCKYKRAKKKKSSPNVIYLPSPNADNYPVYQEVFDDPYDPRYRPSPPSNPPTLPSRYNPNDESAYLEPVPPGSYRGKTQPPLVKTVNNPGYEKPPEYSEREEDSAYVSPPAEDDGYFEPVPNPPETDPPDDEAEPYDTLLDNEEESANSPSRYEPFNSFKSGKLGPDPSERTKKDDRQTESTYFELEKVNEEDTDANV